MTATAAKRVAAGAAHLDVREPGWWRKIDLGRLDLASPCNCVLGQLNTDLTEQTWSGLCDEFGVAPWSEPGNERPTDYALGFNHLIEPGKTVRLAEYDTLADEWVRLIKQRWETS